MRRRTIVLLMAATVGPLLAGASLQAQTMKKQGKPDAPVEIIGSAKAASASLTIRFKAPAQDVSVRVYGTDGLTVVGSETPVTTGTYRAGQTVQLTVAYAAPDGEQSNLAVVVSGQFAGNRRSRIVSFTVGDKSVQALRRSATTVDSEGKTLMIMPAEAR